MFFKKSFTVAIKVRIVLKIIREGIDAANKGLELYDKILEHVIPWDEFKKTLDSLDEFRKEYSVESAALIGETKTLLMNAMDEYQSASRNIFE